jgi:hypothetical protein
MPEIDDVVLSETIEVAWGNAIRDRTVQRYADSTERAAEHPSPAQGDLSYLEDADRLYVWTGSAWETFGPFRDGDVTTAKVADDAITTAKLAHNIMPSYIMGGSDVLTTDSALTTTLTDKASVVFNPPDEWGNALVLAWGYARVAPDTPSGSGVGGARVEIGGSNGTEFQGIVVGGEQAPISAMHMVPSTGTDPLTIAIAVREVSGALEHLDSWVAYIAWRLS